MLDPIHRALASKTHRMRALLVPFTLASLCTIGSAHADTGFDHIASSSILAGTYQHTSGTRDSFNAQLDLLGYFDAGPGQLQYELKAGSTPLSDGVTANYPEANALAGETTSPNGHGRLAITQIYYAIGAGGGELNAGLIFPANYIDTNPVADDEYHQFMGLTFVNDPTIQMPVYVLGGTYSHPLNRTFNVLAMLASTRDLYGHNYPNLLDSGASDRGSFGDLELDWQQGNLQGNFGAWTNTDHDITAPPLATDVIPAPTQNFTRHSAWGVYGNFGGSVPGTGVQWDLRAGWANPKASLASSFVSIQANDTFATSLLAGGRKLTVAAGISRTGASPDAIGPTAPLIQVEAYVRTRLVRSLYISPDVQWIRHTQFLPGQHGQWIEGVRVGLEF
ncbi:hypothetical protein BJI67_01355 [Acidihalobacter aeolianus]|uniref:Porin n=1 Tax=Acidihalobacter aeolianus TaxID=2792603 RepID=A0A1D8K4L6_9GAMM|nr:hypothetical protein [Acidihalobacter aeolianus]AOV15897.1 hypothetical protein BJI67_01355 [Acidihalobacter aeolianus]